MKNLYNCSNILLGSNSIKVKSAAVMLFAFMFTLNISAENLTGTSIDSPTGPYLNADAYNQFDYESALSNNQSMEIECASDITIDCGESTDPSNTGNPTGLENPATITFSDDSNGLCPEIITRTFTIDYDEPKLGSEICVQIITIEDNEAPIVSSVTPVINVDCESDMPAPTVVTATDNCDDDVTIQFISSNGSEGETTCEGIDAIGSNSNFWSIYLVGLPGGLVDGWILDADGAEFTTFADGTAHLTGRVHASNDPNLVFRIEITAKEKKNWTEWSTSPTVPVGGFRTYKDDAGLAAAGMLWETWDYYIFDDAMSFLIGEDGLDGSVLNLTHAPSSLHFGWQVGLAANNINANYGMSSWFNFTGNLNVNGTAYANIEGNGDVNMDTNCSMTEPSCEYAITRTWVAYDDCGNGTSVSQIININDVTPPVMSECPSDITVQCDAIPDVPTITALDNCSGVVPVTFEESAEQSQDCPDEQVITRIWTADDECLNRFTCTQIITVVDTTDPTFTFVPADVTLDCTDAIPVTQATASDNCGTVSESFSDVTAGICPIIITRTFTAIDACGNTATATQIITIEDNDAPVLSDMPADVTAECDNIPEVPALTALDNCDDDPDFSVSTNNTPGACDDAYTRVTTWTATDNCGNTVSHTQTVTVEDNTDPVFANLPPAQISAECDDLPDPADVTATDNCDDDVTIDFSELMFSGGCVGVMERTWTATDNCGNS
ncbi:MAG: hypothetical protein ACI8U0_001141, partial [Flavobacteriales bacterium]